MICCSLTKSHQSVCTLNEEGVAKCEIDSKCVVRALKVSWNKAGFPVILHTQIKKRIFELDKKWQNIRKSRSKTSDPVVKARNDFNSFLDLLFDISVENIERIIELDKLRSPEDKNEDKLFLADQRGPRLREIGDLDKIHETKVIKKVKRNTRKLVENLEIVSPNNTPNYSEYDDDEVDVNSNDADFLLPENLNKRKSNTVKL